MKIKLGKYPTWVGVYQLANLLQKVGVSEDRCDEIGDLLVDTWVEKTCLWVESKRHRTVNIHIDNYDVWSMDHTLSLIITPMLKKLKEEKHGSPFVANEDCRKELHALGSGPRGDTLDPHWHDRWDYVLNEMIYAFEAIKDDRRLVNYEVSTFGTPDENLEMIAITEDRIQNGLRLFGKYYNSLWD